MGTSVLWNSHKGKKPSRFPSLPWAKPVAKNSAKFKVNGSGNTLIMTLIKSMMPNKFATICSALFTAIFQMLKSSPNTLFRTQIRHSHWRTTRIATHYGGSHLQMSDATSGKYFDDTVVEEKRELDTHYQRKEKGAFGRLPL